MRTSRIDDIAAFLSDYIIVAIRAVYIMFIGAAAYKRFDVFAAIGYLEAIAWSLAYGLVRGLFHKAEKR